ncbi:CPCC family cysteine-rich protein [Streptomyces fagopyri]|uniref:CPCC family cysteine-rich protein n=1 Tax=Streptomyces fagopyri TaxID=2662397 RepID=UPI00371EC433
MGVPAARTDARLRQPLPPALCHSSRRLGKAPDFASPCAKGSQDDHDADRVRGGPNGRLSLTEARRNFHAVGACDERCTQFVHPPLPDEHPAV